MEKFLDPLSLLTSDFLALPHYARSFVMRFQKGSKKVQVGTSSRSTDTAVNENGIPGRKGRGKPKPLRYLSLSRCFHGPLPSFQYLWPMFLVLWGGTETWCNRPPAWVRWASSLENGRLAIQQREALLQRHSALFYCCFFASKCLNDGLSVQT